MQGAEFEIVREAARAEIAAGPPGIALTIVHTFLMPMRGLEVAEHAGSVVGFAALHFSLWTYPNVTTARQ